MEQRTDEWLEFRKTKVGGSDIAAIMGISPWKSAYTLWLEKTGRKSDDKATPWMLRGTQLEPLALDTYTQFTDNIVIPSVCTSKNWGIAMASLDGVSEDGKLILEIKCPSDRVFQMALEGKIPEYYKCQMQWQMYVEDRAEMCDYFCFISKERHTLLTIFPDKEYQETLVEAAKGFWECVEKDTPPEIIDTDYVFVEEEEFSKLAKQYIEIDHQIKELESMRGLFKKRLVDFSDDGNVRGAGVKIRRSEGRKTIDWKKVCEKHKITDDHLTEFTKRNAPYWVITVE